MCISLALLHDVLQRLEDSEAEKRKRKMENDEEREGEKAKVVSDLKFLPVPEGK